MTRTLKLRVLCGVGKNDTTEFIGGPTWDTARQQLERRGFRMGDLFMRFPVVGLWAIGWPASVLRAVLQETPK